MTQDRVGVGSVVVKQASGIVHDLGDFQDFFLEQAERIRVRQHKRSGICHPPPPARASRSTSPPLSDGMVIVSNPAEVALAGFVPCAESGTITFVRFFSPAFMPGANHHQPGPFSMRSRGRL